MFSIEVGGLFFVLAFDGSARFLFILLFPIRTLKSRGVSDGIIVIVRSRELSVDVFEIAEQLRLERRRFLGMRFGEVGGFG